MKKIIILILLLFTAALVFSADFGLLLDQKVEAENNMFSYTPGFTPWFSYNNGKGLSLYLSGLFSLKLTHSGSSSSFMFIPELSRFALNYRISRGMTLEAGRVSHADATGLIASGLFDGVRFEADTPAGTLTAGAFYTGFLYKETAKILMTSADLTKYRTPFDIGNFSGYFSSSRVLAAVRWDMPVGKANSLSAELTAQFDLNGGSDTLDSQYAGLQFVAYPTNMIRLTFAAVVETMQGGNNFSLAFGGLAKMGMELPTPVNDMLGVTLKFSTGAIDTTLAAFTPVSATPQGSVFTESISGLAVIGADYTARIIPALSVDAALRYFIATYNVPRSFYGGELWASLAWQPLDDLRATLGAGIFIPGIGDVNPSGPVNWKISAGVTLSF